MSKYLQPGETLPPIPARNPVVTIPAFNLTETSPLLQNLPKPIVSERPIPFELLDQQDALVLYRTTLPAGPAARLVITQLHDYAHISLDGAPIATLDRRRGQNACNLPARAKAVTLDILMDTFGRVNYGGDLHDRKGITEKVELTTEAGTTEVKNWSHFKLPLEQIYQNRKYGKMATTEPAFYRGGFDLKQVGDTFLDTSKLNKGVVWVNGHNLGRYWRLGAQQTLYLPAPWLKTGRNEVVIYEGNGTQTPTLQGLATPILDAPQTEPERLHRKAGQELKTVALTPVLSATLNRDSEWQTFPLPTATTGRYLVFESLSSYTGEPFAALAEINAVNAEGKDVSRLNWKTVYADSEELSAEDGSADNLFDLQATTYWHSRWSGAVKPNHPHQVVIDMGAAQNVSAVRLLQRGGTAQSGRVKEFRIYLSPQLPPGL